MDIFCNICVDEEVYRNVKYEKHYILLSNRCHVWINKPSVIENSTGEKILPENCKNGSKCDLTSLDSKESK